MGQLSGQVLGRRIVQGVEEIGFRGALFGESIYWLLFGRVRQQPVRLHAVLTQAVQIGLQALPIATLLSATIGILIAGRTGSALAARFSTMLINQEVDALRVIGIAPVRYLVAPALVAMIVVVPCLTMWANMVALAAAGLVVTPSLDISMLAYFTDLMAAISTNDLWHGLTKSALFAALVAIVSSLNGALAQGGADGVGRMTTRAVVQSIAAIVLADMIFAYAVTVS